MLSRLIGQRLTLLGALLLAMDACSASAGSPRHVLAYSFEDGLQDFAANGAFILPLTQDTIGATDGTKSLKMNLLQNATYVGRTDWSTRSQHYWRPTWSVFMSFDLTIESISR